MFQSGVTVVSLLRLVRGRSASGTSTGRDFVKDFGLAESLSHELQRIRHTGKYQTEILIEGEPYRLEEKKEINPWPPFGDGGP